jgi:hypothetical protein
MRHPLELIPPEFRSLVFWPLLALTLVFTWGLAILGPGVIPLELAGTVQAASTLIKKWKTQRGARTAALIGTGLDYLYIPIYSCTLALGCIMAGGVFAARGAVAGLGPLLAWGQWLAGMLDVAEDFALLKMLVGPVADPWPRVARGCALPKFLLIAAGSVYAIAGGVAWLLSRHG